MKINNQNSSPIFQRIITGDSAMTAVRASNRLSNLTFQFQNVKKVLHKAQISKSDVLDVIINYNKENGFYCVFIPKKNENTKKSFVYYNNILNSSCIKDLRNKFFMFEQHFR